MSDFNLQRYLNEGVEHVMTGILKATKSHPRMSFSMLQFAAEARRASRLRQKSETAGNHIPPFLIASIADSCNLHCKGCYARENNICSDGLKKEFAETLGKLG
ncbi:MAG: radical SAM protein, partial [Bacillota bacterium]|nr:radical SAM protein [Bacillota bacterium]